jgi:hypothetical protein
MILDGLLQFTTTANANGDNPTTGTQSSTNSLDLGFVGLPTSASGGGARDIGIGDDPAMKLLVQVTTTFTSGGAGTLSVTIQGAIDNGAGAPAAFSSWWASPAYALATLNAGSRLMDMDMPRPPDGIAVPRFLRLNYTVAVATFTAGNLSSWIVLDRDDSMR